MVGADIEARRLMHYLGKMRTGGVPRAIGATIKRAVTTVRARVSRQIRDEVQLTAGTVKAALSITRIPRSSIAVDKLYAEIRARGGPLPLSAYQATMTKAGAKFRVVRGQPRRVYTRAGRTGFIIGKRQARTTASGRTSRRFQADPKFGGNVWVRTSDESTPIRRAFGPGIAQRFMNQSVQEEATRVFRQEFRKRLPIELTHQIRRANRRSTGGRSGR